MSQEAFTPFVRAVTTATAVAVAALVLSACVVAPQGSAGASSAGSGERPLVHAPAPMTTPSHSEAPIAANFPANNQAKLQATQHWMAIADDAAKSLVTMLKSPKVCPGGLEKCRLVAVKPPMVVTEFSRVFRNQLITRLVKLGVPVSKGVSGEMTVEFDVQPIQFSANRPQYRYAGLPAELGAGVWALRDVMTVDPTVPDMTPPPGDALHWFRSEFAAGQTPRTELFITVSVADARKFLSRTSNAYYITDADKRLYDEELCFMFKVCAPAPQKAAVAAAAAAAASKSAESEKVVVKTKTLELVGDCAKERCLEGGSTTKKSTRSSVAAPAGEAKAK